jgi:hypothetical protein
MKARLLIVLLISAIYFNTALFQSDINGQVLNSTDSLRYYSPHDLNPDIIINKFFTNPNLYKSYTSVLFSNINISQNSAPQNEPSVRISRKNPNRVVAAWRDFRYGIDPTANRRVGYSLSVDSGLTWSVPVILDSSLIPGETRNSDPVVGVDSAGNFYIGVIALDIVNSNGMLVVYKSTDGGFTFPLAYSATGSIGMGEDKEYITTDLVPGSPFYNTVYFTWTRFSSGIRILCTKSTNGGVNWSTPVQVSDDVSQPQGSDPAVSLNGQLNVVWLSNTGTSSIYYNKSTDGGNTFGTEMIISTGASPSLPNGASTFPSIAADISGGPRNGYLYTVFTDSRYGDPDVFICRSTNNGNNWSAPERVNNDGIGNGKLQYWPWISVNDNGNIAVIWYDTRNTSDNTIVEAYLARSNDGGLTFTNELLSTQPSPTSVPGGNVRFGDYICIDYWKNKIVPVWTDERAGSYNMEIYTALINTSVGITPSVNNVPDKFELLQNYPNPFNPTTNIKYQIPNNSYVSLKVFDIIGKEITTLVNEKQSPGSYEVSFDGSNLPSGVYFYKLITGNYSETRKMVLIK